MLGQLLTESEKKHRLISENANEIILILDGNFRVEYINEFALKRVLGYLKEELIGKLVIKIAHPEDQEDILNKFKEMFETKEVIVEGRLRHKDGYYIWAELNGKLFFDQSQRPKFRMIIRDITERKLIELKLKASQTIFRHLIETSPYSILLLDYNGKILDCNLTTTTLLGYKKVELINKHVLDVSIFPSELMSILKKREEIPLEGKVPRPLEFQIYKKDGKLIWVNVINTIIEMEGKKIIQVIVQDISEKKEEEIKLRSSEQKYRDAYQRVEFYKDLFTHDVINIFQVISSSTDLFRILNKNVRFPKESEELLDLIKEQTIRGNRLVSNVRTLSKLVDTKIITKPTELYRVLENSIKYVKNSFRTKKIRIHLNFVYHEFKVSANNLLEDVFENILINAIKYNANEVIEILIKISRIVESNRIYIQIEFIDNGIGIPDSLKESIFQRESKEKKGGKGMGLGLSLVFNIIKQYGGKIWVENKVKVDYTQGSNFILLLPEIA
jgi:PAS domain S-box-containing protein